MDADRFDRLVKDLAAPGTRRGVFRLLAALPVAGLLATRRRAAIDAAGLPRPDVGQQVHLPPG
jgi:hypothetical protein